MPVEFLGIAATNDGSETDRPLRAELRQGVHAPAGPRPRGERLGPGPVRLRLRRPGPGAGRRLHRRPAPRRCSCCWRTGPNVSYPTFAAKTFATLDQISDGRLTVHFITGGNDHEQQREGDYLTKDERYARTREYIQIVKQAWTDARAVRPRGRALPLRTTSSATSSRSSSRARTSPSAARRRPPTRPAAPRRTSTACGASRWPRPPSRSSR